METREAEALSAWWSDNDLRGLRQAGELARAKPEDLILVLVAESGAKPWAVSTCPPVCGGSPAPSRKYINAVGLNQLTSTALYGLGILDDKGKFQEFAQKLSKSGVYEQLGYVVAYFQNSPWFRNGKSYENALRIYLTNAAYGLSDAKLTDPSGQVYGGAAAAANPNRATIGGLSSGLNFYRNSPLYLAFLKRLSDLADLSIDPIVVPATKLR